MRTDILGRKLSAYELLELAKDKYGFKIEAPIDLDRIVELLGIKVNSDLILDKDHIGKVGYIKIKDGDPYIWINPLENSLETRQRFTLAHELGHLFLHINPSVSGNSEYYDTAETLNRTTTVWNKQEKEANDFAAKLLMPLDLINKEGKALISRYKEEHGENISKELFISAMASKFLVSRAAMEYRLKNLGVV